MFCTRARSCARADDAKIVSSRNAHAKLGNHLKIISKKTIQMPCNGFLLHWASISFIAVTCVDLF